MITLKEAAAVAGEFERLPESMETLRRWTRRKIISKPADEIFHGGDIGREVFYPDQIIAEVITTIRLKNNHGFTLEEIAKGRLAFNKVIDSMKDKDIFKKDNKLNLKIIKNSLDQFRKVEQSGRRKLSEAAAAGASIEELQEIINEIKSNKKFRTKTIKYAEVYLKVLDDLESRKLNKAN